VSYFPRPLNATAVTSRTSLENTIKEMKAMSHKKRVRLGDAEPDEHFIVFYKGKMVDIICPHGKTKKASRK
jgi:hypothetical protein